MSFFSRFFLAEGDDFDVCFFRGVLEEDAAFDVSGSVAFDKDFCLGEGVVAISSASLFGEMPSSSEQRRDTR